MLQGATRDGGKVLLHCSQGVSRSAALAIAHLMWRTGQPFDEAFSAVKQRRGIVNPNIGFTCQVLCCRLAVFRVFRVYERREWKEGSESHAPMHTQGGRGRQGACIHAVSL